MALFGKGIADLNDLFVDELKNVFYIENEIVDSLPIMIEAATSPELKRALSSHLEETKEQVKRLEQVFEMWGERPENGGCPAIDGLIKEAAAGPNDIEDTNVLDAAVVTLVQRIAHHEIAVYGSIMAWAKELGHEDCAAILSASLEEEKATDRKLSKLAEHGINRLAA